MTTSPESQQQQQPQQQNGQIAPTSSSPTAADAAQRQKQQRQMWKVIWFVPNILCYLRILLGIVGMITASLGMPGTTMILWISTAFLDMWDGILARRLNQCSALGVLLDIVADNFLRSASWVCAAAASLTYAATAPWEVAFFPHMLVPTMSCCIICLEWVTLLATQLMSLPTSQHWKTTASSAKNKEEKLPPLFVRWVFYNNFRNPLGALVIYGLFGSGVCVYGWYNLVSYRNQLWFRVAMYSALFGRFLSIFVELYLVGKFLYRVILNDSTHGIAKTL